MPEVTEEEAARINRDRVFMMDDPAMVKAYIAFCHKHSREIKKCRKEVLALTGREPMLYDARTHVYMAGLRINPEGWRESERDRLKAEDVAAGKEPRGYYGYIKDAPIPPGWRKRVKDDFLCPPLKGGGPEAEAARALCKKYAKLEGPRGYLQRVHGVKPQVFAGLVFATIGIDVVGDKGSEVIYVNSKGPEQDHHPMTGFVEVKKSAYLMAKGE